MVRFRGIFAVIFIFVSGLSFGQDGHYMVFFKDKVGTPFSIDRPAEFLSEKSISRRAKQNIAIVEQDLPVNPNYVRQIRDLGVITYYPSRWMNGLLIEARRDKVEEIIALDFVRNVEYVAPARNLQSARLDDAKEAKDFNLVKGIKQVFQTQTITRQLEIHGIQEMHSAGFRGDGMMIAVLDDGFRGHNTSTALTHLSQRNKILDRYDFAIHTDNLTTGFTHGTRVLSIIASERSDFIGSAPDAFYLLYVTEDSRWEMRIEEYNWLFGAERADSVGVDIIQTSLGYGSGFTDPQFSYTPSQMDGKTSVIARSAEIAFSKGIFLVNSAGNYGNVAWRIIATPADAENVLAVGAINGNGVIANFSSRGPTADGRTKPDVMAVGSGTILVNQNGTRTNESGTSFAAPVMTGFIANIWQEFPYLTNAQLFDFVKRSGDRVNNPDNDFGFGVPHYTRLRELLITSTRGDEAERLWVFPNPAEHVINISSGRIFQPGKDLQIQILDMSGRSVYADNAYSSDGALRTELSLISLKPGVYVLKVNDGKKMAYARVVKK